MSIVDGPIISGDTIPTTTEPSGYLLSTKGATIIIGATRSPAPNSPGVVGELSWDINGIYICVAANTWKHIPFIN